MNIAIGVTGAGTPAGDAMLARLKECGYEGRLVALDYDHAAMAGSPASARALLAPPSRGWEVFRSRLLDARNRFGLGAVIPADPAHLALFVRFREALEEDRLRTFLPTPGQYALRDRERLAILAPRIDARTPATRRIGTQAELFKHWCEFAKPAVLSSPAGESRRVDRFDEAAFVLDEIEYERGLPALLRGAAGVSAFRASGVGDGEGNLDAFEIRAGAAPFVAHPETYRELAYIAENFAHVTRWRGGFELVFGRDRDGVVLNELVPAPAACPLVAHVRAIAARLTERPRPVEAKTDAERLVAV